MTKTRFIAAIIFIFAGAVYYFEMISRPDPRIAKCRNTGMETAVIADCEAFLNEGGLSVNDSGQIAFALGFKLHDEDWEQALAYNSQSIAANPEVKGAFFNRGLLRLHQTEDFVGAIADFSEYIQRASAVDERLPHAHLQRGLAYRSHQQYALALTDFNAAIDIEPTYQRAHREMEKLVDDAVRLHLDDASGLINFAETGLHGDPDSLRFLYLRALGHLGEGNFVRALIDINQVIEMAEYPQTYIFARARINRIAGQYDLAMEDLNELTQSPDHNGVALNDLAGRAEELMAAGRDAESAVLDSQVGDLAELYIRALRERLSLDRHLSNWSDAVETVDLMIAYDPDSSDHWIARGEILEEMGQNADAIESYSAAIRLVELGARDVISNTDAQVNALLRRGVVNRSERYNLAAQADFDAALTLGGADVIRAFQQKMQTAGHYEGALNGAYDENTKSAVRRCALDVDC